MIAYSHGRLAQQLAQVLYTHKAGVQISSPPWNLTRRPRVSRFLGVRMDNQVEGRFSGETRAGRSHPLQTDAATGQAAAQTGTAAEPALVRPARGTRCAYHPRAQCYEERRRIVSGHVWRYACPAPLPSRKGVPAWRRSSRTGW